MGYSGLIYAAIVAAWAGILIPRWLRRNEELDQARETDAARGVRVLQRRTNASRVMHRPTPRGDSTVFASSGRAVGNPTAGYADLARASGNPNAAIATVGNHAARGDAPFDAVGKSAAVAGGARSVPDLAGLDEAFALAATRRRRVLVALLGSCVLSMYAVVDAMLPPLVLIASFGALAMFLIAGRRAVIQQQTRRAIAARAARAEMDREVAAETADDFVADDAVDSVRVAVLDEPEIDFVDPDAWDPVDVPRPTYLSKPAAPRLVRTIDLTQPGSWTSGRLDPAGAIDLPRHAPASADHEDLADTDDMPEHRRAVGD